MARPNVTTYALVFADGSVARSQVVEGCEADAFPKIEGRHGRFTAHKVEPHAFPADDPYRAAWRLQDAAIVHDMPKAREVHRDILRRERKAILAALDVQFMRALEAGQDTAAIVAEKTRLRDITADSRIEAAQTIDDLKLVQL